MAVPADLTPSQFFETYLPAEWARARAGAAAPPDATFEVTLDGDGGGTWTIAVAGGALATTAAAAAAPQLRVRMTVADFRAALQGEAGAPDLFPHDLDLARLISRIPAGGGAVPLVQGKVAIGISGFAGRTWRVELEAGGGGGPSAQLTVDADTIAQLRAGTLDPAAAFFGGKIQLGGDIAWIMQAGMGFMQGRGRGPLN